MNLSKTRKKGKTLVSPDVLYALLVQYLESLKTDGTPPTLAGLQAHIYTEGYSFRLRDINTEHEELYAVYDLALYIIEDDYLTNGLQGNYSSRIINHAIERLRPSSSLVSIDKPLLPNTEIL